MVAWTSISKSLMHTRLIHLRIALRICFACFKNITGTHCKGHAGLKPCMVCTNVCMSDRNLEGENPDGTQIVNSQCIDTTKWVRATDDSARETMEMLRERKPGMGKDDFKDLEKAVGFT